ncbi:NUDIX domain-containing protein [Candidatus Kaiserbacteria bacterium]|nr:NUDIX domain-containing protein [Candidatus Kaiserbacteria bacterium]
MQKGVDYPGITVTYVCHDGVGNILMQKRGINCRDENGTWDTGGGGLELHDTVEETLRKEIAEEYKTDVLGFDFLGYRDVHCENNGVKTHWLALDFKVLVDRDKAQNGEPHKFDAIGWFAKDSLPSPLHSQLPFYFEKYKKELWQA